MKKAISVLVAVITVLSMLPLAFAETLTVGSGIGVGVSVENFVPQIFMDPHHRIVWENAADGSSVAYERIENYAFEGEQIQWDVVVWDKNGIDKVKDVYVTVGPVAGEGNPTQANCQWNTRTDAPGSIGAWDVETPNLQFDPLTMRWYTCILTVEPSVSMAGHYWVAAEVEDLSGQKATFDEKEYWFFNPTVSIGVTGALNFGTVRPGTRAYSTTLVVTNNAQAGSGVLLDMAISGTDFYDLTPGGSGAKCPDSNVLRLNSGGGSLCQMTCVSKTGVNVAPEKGGQDNFCYFASNGAYTTAGSFFRADNEGYVGIPYETGDPDDRVQIISGPTIAAGHFAGNVLSPGADMSITFRLDLPVPCNGAFGTYPGSGQIYFWGEAI
jgi:hypothetical protein